VAAALLFNTLIRALAEETTHQKHAVASRGQAPDIQVADHEFEMLNGCNMSK
jgi:hypothetical protein